MDMVSQRVVPTAVKIRVAVIITAALFLSASPWLLFSPLLAGAVQAVIIAVGLYVGWCLWPRWRWGISEELLGELPVPQQQPIRLTFDDGPTSGLTERVLDLLQQYGVRASFFVLVPKARARPDLIRRILAEGHLLGLHGQDHRAPFFRSADELHASLSHARAELEALAGQPVQLYRPSHGWKNAALVRAVRKAGLKMSFWNLGVWDTDAPTLPLLLERLGAAAASADHEARPVVLLHDGLGDDPAVPPHGEVMAAALSAWLPTVAARS